MTKKKLLVCGATGFIGRNISEYLAEQNEFEVIGTYFKSEPLAHPKIKMLQVDLTRPEQVAKVTQGIDTIIQAAATTSGAKDVISKPYKHVTDNAVMNSLIFRAAYDNSVSHLVFFSCTVMYQSSDTPLKEKDFDANQELNKNYFGAGWTKVYLEKMGQFYSRLGRTKYTILRHSNIYGPYDKYDLEKSHVFGATMTKVMTSRDGKIIVWGTGEEERDLLYISDIVDFVDLALSQDQEAYQLYNVGYGSTVSIKQLVQKIVDCSGKQLVIEHDLSKPTIKTALCLDCSKAKHDLGWVPQVTLEHGIRKTMDWYQKNY